MDGEQDFELSQFLVLDDNTTVEYTEPQSHLPSIVVPFPPAPADSGTYDSFDIVDGKNQQLHCENCPWSWSKHYLQQASPFAIPPLTAILSPESRSSSFAASPCDEHSICLFPDLPTCVEPRKTLKDPETDSPTKASLCMPRQHDLTAESQRQQQQQQQQQQYHHCSTTISKPPRKRTPTSYDARTSNYLVRAFFETYGRGAKISTEQRKSIVKQTGLTSRRITYWFSNHKRRFRHELDEYTRLLEEGAITNYDDFISFCRAHDGLKLQTPVLPGR